MINERKEMAIQQQSEEHKKKVEKEIELLERRNKRRRARIVDSLENNEAKTMAQLSGQKPVDQTITDIVKSSSKLPRKGQPRHIGRNMGHTRSGNSSMASEQSNSMNVNETNDEIY